MPSNAKTARIGRPVALRVPEQQCFQCRGDFVGVTREHASAPERKHWQRRTRALNHFDGANSCAAPSRTAAACRRRGHDADGFHLPDKQTSTPTSSTRGVQVSVTVSIGRKARRFTTSNSNIEIF
jgi:hypothetical protein